MSSPEAKKKRPPRVYNKRSPATGEMLCFYCEEEMTLEMGPRKKTIDHIVPSCLHGTNTVSNKLKSCHECNKEKRDLLPGHYAQIIEFIYLPNATTLEQKLRLQKIMQNCVHLSRYISINKEFVFKVKTNF